MLGGLLRTFQESNLYFELVWNNNLFDIFQFVGRSEVPDHERWR